MKHKLLATISLLCSACGIFATENYMTVELKNGDLYSFLLADKPVVSYNDASLVINSNDKTSYAISDVKNYHFTKSDATSLETVNSFLRIVNIDDKTVEVQNAKPMLQVTLTSTSGVQILSSCAGSDGRVVVKLPESKGVYLLSVGDQSFKVIRK